MVMADVFAVVFGTLAVLLALPAFVVVWRGVLPGHLDQARLRVAQTPGRSLITGVLASGVVLLPFALLVNVPLGPVRLLGVWWLAAGLGLSLAGAGGLADHVGRQLWSPADVDRPWRATLKGAVALELACLVPVLGWFAVLPLVMVLGLGAATLGAIRRLDDPDDEAATPPLWAVERAS